MKKIGLTGGIGSGKSHIARVFEALQVPVFYADDQAKNILNEVETIQEVSKALSSDIVDVKTGLADRKKIAQLVFNNDSLLGKLNGIIHPKVEQRFVSWCSTQQHYPYILKEAAILFESGSYQNLDGVICVLADIDLRIARVAQRDQQSKEEILKRIQHQWTDEQRISRATWIIENNKNSKLLPQVLRIHQSIV